MRIRAKEQDIMEKKSINKDSISSTGSLFNTNDWNIFVVLPAYNESKTIRNIIEELQDRKLNIIVIDDGSKDNTYNIAEDSIYSYNGFIYKHILNRGLGAALKTGIMAALKKDADIIVTFDADGQHDPDDIIPVCKPIMEGKADFVIGKRNFEEMPTSKRIGNTIMNDLTRLFYGIHVNDSQSGLRAFDRKAAEIIEINSHGYGVSSEIIGEMKNYNLKIVEVPIKTIYTDYSISKGTNLVEGLRILFKLIVNLLRKVLS